MGEFDWAAQGLKAPEQELQAATLPPNPSGLSYGDVRMLEESFKRYSDRITEQARQVQVAMGKLVEEAMSKVSQVIQASADGEQAQQDRLSAFLSNTMEQMQGLMGEVVREDRTPNVTVHEKQVDVTVNPTPVNVQPASPSIYVDTSPIVTAINSGVGVIVTAIASMRSTPLQILPPKHQGKKMRVHQVSDDVLEIEVRPG